MLLWKKSENIFINFKNYHFFFSENMNPYSIVGLLDNCEDDMIICMDLFKRYFKRNSVNLLSLVGITGCCFFSSHQGFDKLMLS